MDVIIVSKTHMNDSACVGAITGSGRFVRLLKTNGFNQDVDTKLEVGDVYTIKYTERPNKKAPHVEDILVSEMNFKSSFESIEKMVDYLKGRLNIKIWEGAPDVLFDGKLNWTERGSGFINEENGLPENSVGFWCPDRDLNMRIFYEKVRYNYPNINGWRSFPYVGCEEPVETIGAGSLVRVSLARWWDTKGKTEDRCSLQISGWYILK